MPEVRKSWWHTAPGILTVTAGVAMGLIGVLFQLNLSGDKHKAPSNPVVGTGAKLVRVEPLPIPQLQDLQLAEVQNSTATLSNSPVALRISIGNILAPKNGGRLVVADNDSWLKSIDGKKRTEAIFREGKSAPVYAFKNRQSATFDTFRIFIGSTNSTNVKEFELLVGNESPTGPFESIGTFQTENTRYFGDPYQEFTFPPTSAKYLKVRILSSWGRGDGFVQEIQLLGRMDESQEPAQFQE